MSRNARTNARQDVPPGKARHRRTSGDLRTRRTRQRLGTALVELIWEKPINEITIQEVLDRADVGRSTFYLHYRDKNDLLLSQLEMFLEVMSTWLIARKEQSLRIVPVAEMFEHIGGQNRMYRALSDAGRLNDFFDLAQGYFARGIAQRLRESRRLPNLSRFELSAHATALAGSLLSLLRWWIDHGAKQSPQAMDELFHRMVWSGLQSSCSGQ
jgi:AcrR family transcriptional regulator